MGQDRDQSRLLCVTIASGASRVSGSVGHDVYPAVSRICILPPATTRRRSIGNLVLLVRCSNHLAVNRVVRVWRSANTSARRTSVRFRAGNESHCSVLAGDARGGSILEQRAAEQHGVHRRVEHSRRTERVENGMRGIRGWTFSVVQGCGSELREFLLSGACKYVVRKRSSANRERRHVSVSRSHDQCNNSLRSRRTFGGNDKYQCVCIARR